MDNHFRLKLKLATGEEFEAEGSRDFIAAEKEVFLACAQTPRPDTQKTRPIAAIWTKIANTQGGTVILGPRSPEIGQTEAVILILAAAKNLAEISPYNALGITKSLKKSGYPKIRLDRLLSEPIRDGMITPRGTKRSRSYELCQKGEIRAYNLASRILKPQ